MTSLARPSYDSVLAAAADLHLLERRRAAQTVRNHVPAEEGQQALLECLGLQDVAGD